MEIKAVGTKSYMKTRKRTAIVLIVQSTPTSRGALKKRLRHAVDKAVPVGFGRIYSPAQLMLLQKSKQVIVCIMVCIHSGMR
jgi:hypothetical protein